MLGPHHPSDTPAYDQVRDLLAADPVCGGRVSTATIKHIAGMMADAAEHPRDHNARAFDVDPVGTIRTELNLFAERRDEIVAKATAFVTIRDRIDLQKATDIVGIAQTVGGMVEDERKKLTGPLYDAQRAVNEYAAYFWHPALEAITALTERMEAYQVAEEARRIAQQDEQAAHEARLRAGPQPAAAPDPAPPVLVPAARQPAAQPVRSDYGFAARRRFYNVIEIVDVRALPDWVFQSQSVIDAIIATVKPLVDKNVVLPGLKSTKATKTKVTR